MANTIEFNKKCIPATDYVVVRIINRNEDMKLGHVFVAQSEFSNERVAHAQVLEVGENAAKEYGLKKDDYVVLDRLATVAQTAPIAVIKYVNILAKTDDKNETFSPLRNMVFVKDDREVSQKIGNVYVSKAQEKINLGKIVAMNIDEDIKVPYAVGDEVMITKGGDSFQIGNEHIFIYKYDMLCCKVVNE